MLRSICNEINSIFYVENHQTVFVLAELNSTKPVCQLQHTSNLKEGKVFWRCEFHKAGCKGRATYVGEAVDVTTCTEHYHPPDQASSRAKKLVTSMRKGQ